MRIAFVIKRDLTIFVDLGIVILRIKIEFYDYTVMVEIISVTAVESASFTVWFNYKCKSIFKNILLCEREMCIELIVFSHILGKRKESISVMLSVLIIKYLQFVI